MRKLEMEQLTSPVRVMIITTRAKLEMWWDRRVAASCRHPLLMFTNISCTTDVVLYMSGH